MISAWGVDHGDVVSKAAPPDKYNGNGKPSGGRYAAGYFFSGFHGAAAGKKGKKLRSAGNELLGTYGGATAGTALAIAARKPHLAGATSLGGQIGGSITAVGHNQKKGYYKPQRG